MGIFRLDFLSCYFSEQVMTGFVLGGCVHGNIPIYDTYKKSR